jgi:sugar-specific transcriptional regulator TrmB
MTMFVTLLPSNAKNLKQQIKLLRTGYVSEGSCLGLQFSELPVLVDLGLTEVQARLYLALVKFGSSKILTISKNSNVARPEIYRNLEKLQDLGLVEKIIKRPAEYRAISIGKGLSLLLETKTRKYQRLKAETRLLLRTAKMKKTQIEKRKNENPRFVLIPRARVVDRINTSIQKAQLSIDAVISWKRFSRGVISSFTESIEKAKAKKVKIRFIVENPLKTTTSKQVIDFFNESNCCQIKCSPNYPETVFGIYDKKEVFIIVFSKADLSGSSALWSDSGSIISLASNYFELLWQKAIKCAY